MKTEKFNVTKVFELQCNKWKRNSSMLPKFVIRRYEGKVSQNCKRYWFYKGFFYSISFFSCKKTWWLQYGTILTTPVQSYCGCYHSRKGYRFGNLDRFLPPFWQKKILFFVILFKSWLFFVILFNNCDCIIIAFFHFTVLKYVQINWLFSTMSII